MHEQYRIVEYFWRTVQINSSMLDTLRLLVAVSFYLTDSVGVGALGIWRSVMTRSVGGDNG